MAFRQPFQGDYPITLDYGEKWLPLYTDESPHRGIDYGCPMGTPILASDDGYVTFIGRLKEGYGNYIILSHEKGYATVYAHLSEILVRDNQRVTKGQVIGKSGSTGNSSGPHLHFEVRINGIKIDPKTVLQSVIDTNPSNYTPQPEKPQFDTLRAGTVIVVCDYANVRCHCDMNRVMGQRKKGDILSIGDEVTMYNGLPYRDYYDPYFKCWLRIAEHDPDTQIISNCEI